ncbi:MAG TPA: transposase [Ktedonobacteraceae bacterium]
MLDLPTKIIQMLDCFKGAFSERVWEWAKELVIGAILAPGERTVAAILRVMGRSDEQQFQNYQRVLNRAKWSSRAVSRSLLVLLVKLFVPARGPVVMGIDETIERRRGSKIAARGIYRDAVRTSKEFFVKTSGLRWISMMLLTPIPWAQRVWALPFLTVLAPSQRFHEQRGKRHKTITDWARQMIRQVHRWLPQRALVIVGDGSYAVVEFLAHVIRLPLVTMVTRMRLDAALYDPAPARQAGKKGRPAVKGKRQPTLAKRLADPQTVWQKCPVSWYGGLSRQVELATGTALWYHAGVAPVPIRWVLIRDPEGKFASQAVLCTDQNADPVQILAWFVMRWQVEVTFHEVRTHVGVETQRQWSDLAILRTTPALLGLFSLVTICAQQVLGEQAFPVRQAAWYAKALPTFSATLAFVRQHLWPSCFFARSSSQHEVIEIPRALFDRLVDTLAFTA